MAELVCRCCGKGLSEARGCAVCEDAREAISQIRDNLKEKEEVSPSLQNFSGQTIRLLKLNQDRLEKEMTQVSEKGNSFQDIGFNSGHADEAVKLAKAVALVMKEARALEKEMRSRASATTLEEKCQIMVDFFRKLPPEHKLKVHQALAREYTDAKSSASKP